jgi:hypothetical protein
MFSLAMVSKYFLKLWIGGMNEKWKFTARAGTVNKAELAGIEQRPIVYRSLDHSDLDYSESKL